MDCVIPATACPSFRLPAYTSINPHDKHRMGKSLNFQERKSFQGICEMGEDQIIDCYHELDKDMIAEEVATRCADCPYAFSKKAKWHKTNRHPWFIGGIANIEWDAPKCFVYFISDGEFVKIGVAKNTAKRLADLQVGNARPLELLCGIPLATDREAFELEQKLHREYARFAKHGEWFGILDYIVAEEWKHHFGEDDNG